MPLLEIPASCCCYRHLSAKSSDSAHPHCPEHGDGKPHLHWYRYKTDTVVVGCINEVATPT